MAGAQPEYFPVILALAASGPARGSTTSSHGGHGGSQRADRHELGMNCRHRRHGTVQPRQRDHRPGLRPALAEPAGRLRAGPHLHGLPGQQLRLQQRDLRRERRAERPWEPFHVQHGFKPTDSIVSVFTGCRSTSFTLGVREKHWREHVRNMLRGMDAHNAPTFLLDPITARQFIDRGGFDTKEKLIQWVYENALMPASEYWDYQLIQNYIYPRATFGEEPYAIEAQSRAGRNDPRCSSPRRFTSSWSAAKPTGTGASWVATIRRRYRWMRGGRPPCACSNRSRRSTATLR